MPLTNLGKPLTAREVATFLNLHYKTVLKEYSRLGGIRIGRKIFFFESRLTNALAEAGQTVDRPGEAGGQKGSESTSYQGAGPDLGVRPPARVRRKLADPFGIFPGGSGK